MTVGELVNIALGEGDRKLPTPFKVGSKEDDFELPDFDPNRKQ